MSLLARLAVLLALLGVGATARSVGLLVEPWRGRLNAIAFYVVLPALLFDSTHDEPLSELLSPALVAGLVVVMGLTAAIGWIVHRRIDARPVRSVALVQSYHTNFGYLGLPIVALTLGSAAAAKAGVILGFGALAQAPLTVFFLVAINDAEASVRREVRKVVTNPIVIALVAGLLISALDLSIPAAAETAVASISAVALPIALILVGSGLELETPTGEYGTIGSVVALKVLLMPAIAWVTYTALGVGPIALKAGVVMFAAPTALSTFVYAGELGGDERFASMTIFATTVASMVTISGIVRMLG